MAPDMNERAAASPPSAGDGAAFPGLAAGECHVWTVALEQAADAQAALQRHLSADELQHLAALRLPALRRQYAVTRGALRLLLGRYLDMPPALCRYTTGRYGKPALIEPRLGLHFNVAHSGGQALIAITRGTELGVDIELQRPLDDMAGLARSILSAADLERWLGLPQAQRQQAFYAIWTRKEAVAKAAGLGLSMDFPGLSVEFGPRRPAAVRGIDNAFGQPSEWLLADLQCPPGYSAALAARAQALRISLYAAPDGYK